MSSVQKKSEKKGSFFATPEGHRSPDTIENYILRRFNKNEYDQLKQDFVKFGIADKELKTFFEQKGTEFLTWVLNASSSKPLQSLMDVVPNHLKETLEKDNFYVLTYFSLGQMGAENLSGCSLKRAQSQVQKFKMLLNINSKAVETFMAKGMAEKEPLSDGLKASFANALEQFKEENSPPAKKLAAS